MKVRKTIAYKKIGRHTGFEFAPPLWHDQTGSGMHPDKQPRTQLAGLERITLHHITVRKQIINGVEVHHPLQLRQTRLLLHAVRRGKGGNFLRHFPGYAQRHGCQSQHSHPQSYIFHLTILSVYVTRHAFLNFLCRKPRPTSLVQFALLRPRPRVAPWFPATQAVAMHRFSLFSNMP